jgi:hypothetical protein
VTAAVDNCKKLSEKQGVRGAGTLVLPLRLAPRSSSAASFVFKPDAIGSHIYSSFLPSAEMLFRVLLCALYERT